MNNSTIWLLWDGDCEFCRASAEWIAQRDLQHRLTIISYQEAPSPPMNPALVVQAKRAVQIVKANGIRFSGAAAVLFALETAGWHAGVMGFARHRPILWGAEVAYRIVARNRGRFACRACRGS